MNLDDLEKYLRKRSTDNNKDAVIPGSFLAGYDTEEKVHVGILCMVDSEGEIVGELTKKIRTKEDTDRKVILYTLMNYIISENAAVLEQYRKPLMLSLLMDGSI